MDKIEIGDKVINVKTKEIGIVVSGKICSHDHILWSDGSRSDLNNELEGYKVEKYKECKNGQKWKLWILNWNNN